MTKKALWIVVIILVLIMVCIISSVGVAASKRIIMIPNVVETQEAPVADEQLCVPACDPSTIPFTDMGELDPNVETVINGPAIYEWWTGGSDEGVQRVDVGETVTIHGSAGHWWTLPNQQGLDCVWDLHVRNYGAKPQHVGKTYEQLVVPPPDEYLK